MKMHFNVLENDELLISIFRIGLKIARLCLLKIRETNSGALYTKVFVREGF